MSKGGKLLVVGDYSPLPQNSLQPILNGGWRVNIPAPSLLMTDDTEERPFCLGMTTDPGGGSLHLVLPSIIHNLLDLTCDSSDFISCRFVPH